MLGVLRVLCFEILQTFFEVVLQSGDLILKWCESSLYRLVDVGLKVLLESSKSFLELLGVHHEGTNPRRLRSKRMI